ncbi:hypothetical protein [Microlunatus soli]|nr:hypothetical protein [Microlunatus soli]
MRTDPDHQGLVVSYIGGACDGRARLAVTEKGSRIDAKVLVERKMNVSCTDVGIPRTVAARLARPIGERTVWSSGREYVPFDGAHLLTPAPVPAGFGGVNEKAESWAGPTSPRGRVVTSTWVTSRFDANAAAPDGECRATRGFLTVEIGPVPAGRTSGRAKVGTARIGTATAQVYRDGPTDDPAGWSYVWQVDHRRVELGNSGNCNEQDRLLSRTELLRVARSLQPA